MTINIQVRIFSMDYTFAQYYIVLFVQLAKEAIAQLLFIHFYQSK